MISAEGRKCWRKGDVTDGGFTLEVTEMLDNLVLDVEAGWVKGGDQGSSILVLLGEGGVREEYGRVEELVIDPSMTAGGNHVY